MDKKRKTLVFIYAKGPGHGSFGFCPIRIAILSALIVEYSGFLNAKVAAMPAPLRASASAFATGTSVSEFCRSDIIWIPLPIHKPTVGLPALGIPTPIVRA